LLLGRAFTNDGGTILCHCHWQILNIPNECAHEHEHDNSDCQN
jgi:hypothetical protein